MGFARRAMAAPEIDARMEKIGVEAARRKFSPEFMNRLDKVVVFNSLHEKAIRRILDLELEMVQRRILAGGAAISCSVAPTSEGFPARRRIRPALRRPPAQAGHRAPPDHPTLEPDRHRADRGRRRGLR